MFFMGLVCVSRGLGSRDGPGTSRPAMASDAISGQWASADGSCLGNFFGLRFYAPVEWLKALCYMATCTSLEAFLE